MIVYIRSLSKSFSNRLCFQAISMSIDLVRVNPPKPDNFPIFWHIFLVYNFMTPYVKQSVELTLLIVSNYLRNGDRRTSSCAVGGVGRSCIFPVGISTDASVSTYSDCSQVFSYSAFSATSSSSSTDTRPI